MTEHLTPLAVSQSAPSCTPDSPGLFMPASARASRQIRRGYPPIVHSFANSFRCDRSADSSELCTSPLSRASIRRILERPNFWGWLTCGRGCGSPGGVPQSAARWISCCSCSWLPPSRKTGRDLAANQRDLAVNGTPGLRTIGGNIGALWTDARNSFSLSTCPHTLFSVATTTTEPE
jgi:hypothetical protein